MTHLTTEFHPDSTIILPGSARPRFPHRNTTLLKQRHRLVSPDLIRLIFEQKLGCSPKITQPVFDGKGACLYKIENEQDRSFIMKIGLFLDHHNPAEEVLFNTIIKSHTTDIPVPGTYVLDMSAEIIKWPYSIVELLPGTPIVNLISSKSFSDTENIFECTGQCLRLIHDIRIPSQGFGPVTAECIREFTETRAIPRPLRCRAETVSDCCVHPATRATDYLLNSSLISKQDHASIISLLTGEVIERDDIVLQHGDISMGNFLIHKNRLTGVLDGSAHIGYRLEELVNAYVYICSLAFHFSYFSAEEAFRALLRGYGTDYKKLKQDRNYRFFLVTKLVNHIGILYGAERLRHVTGFVDLLRKNY